MNRPHLGPLRQSVPGCSRRGGQRRAALAGGVRLANAQRRSESESGRRQRRRRRRRKGRGRREGASEKRGFRAESPRRPAPRRSGERLTRACAVGRLRRADRRCGAQAGAKSLISARPRLDLLGRWLPDRPDGCGEASAVLHRLRAATHCFCSASAANVAFVPEAETPGGAFCPLSDCSSARLQRPLEGPLSCQAPATSAGGGRPRQLRHNLCPNVNNKKLNTVIKSRARKDAIQGKVTGSCSVSFLLALSQSVWFHNKKTLCEFAELPRKPHMSPAAQQP